MVAQELWGILTTFRRNERLAGVLSALAGQTRRLDHLVVVDNGGDAASVIEPELAAPRAASKVTLLTQNDNLGPAGAIHVGMRFVLAHAGADSWVSTFDDDDPPQFTDTIERLWETVQDLLDSDPRVGAVGVVGCRFNPKRVRVLRLRDDELTGAPLRVTTLGGGQVPMIRVAALARTGPYRAELFFGHEELEFFLRLNRDGWHVYCDSALLLQGRRARARTGALTVRTWNLGPADWRRYYSIRNRIFIGRRYCGLVPTVRVMGELMAKLAVNLLREPRVVGAHATLTLRASFDGLSGRLGRRWSPELALDGQLPLHPQKREPMAQLQDKES